LLDERYYHHENFIDQVAMADVLVANKMDLCDAEAEAAFEKFVAELQPPKQAVLKTQRGHIDIELLNLPAATHYQPHFPQHHEHREVGVTEQDGYQSMACQFSAETVFSYDSLQRLFREWGERDDDIRIKAILHTDRGWMIFNGIGQQLEHSKIEMAVDNRLELIARGGVIDKQHNEQAVCHSLRKTMLE